MANNKKVIAIFSSVLMFISTFFMDPVNTKVYSQTVGDFFIAEKNESIESAKRPSLYRAAAGSSESEESISDNDIITNVGVDSETVDLGQSFKLKIDFFAENSEKLKEKYEYELSDDGKLSIVLASGYEDSVAIEKNGKVYGKATFIKNKVIIEFYKDKFKDCEDISGSISFWAIIALEGDYTHRPNISEVKNIKIGDKDVDIKVEHREDDSETSGKQENPFFKSGKMNSDGTITWGLVFNQNMEDVYKDGFDSPIELYDDTGRQMKIIQDKERFRLSIHNKDMYSPYFESNIEERKYPVNIHFEEKNDGYNKYLSIVADYTRNHSVYGYSDNGSIEIGRIYFSVPQGVYSCSDFLMRQGIEFNSKGAYFLNRTDMYVVIYPGFARGKYFTLTYATSVNKDCENDKEFFNSVFVNYPGTKIDINDGYRAVVESSKADAEIDFKVRKGYCSIYNYCLNTSDKEAIESSIFKVYSSKEEAVSESGKEIYRVETKGNGYTEEFKLENGKTYYVKQVYIKNGYEIETSIKSFKMKNNRDKGYIYEFPNRAVERTLPQTGGFGAGKFVKAGIAIQVFFMLVKKVID